MRLQGDDREALMCSSSHSHTGLICFEGEITTMRWINGGDTQMMRLLQSHRTLRQLGRRRFLELTDHSDHWNGKAPPLPPISQSNALFTSKMGNVSAIHIVVLQLRESHERFSNPCTSNMLKKTCLKPYFWAMSLNF